MHRSEVIAQKRLVNTNRLLRVYSAALLVLLAGTARTGIVAANLSSAYDLLNRLVVTGACHTRLLQFTALLALKLLFQFVHRGRAAVPVSVRARGNTSLR